MNIIACTLSFGSCISLALEHNCDCSIELFSTGLHELSNTIQYTSNTETDCRATLTSRF